MYFLWPAPISPPFFHRGVECVRRSKKRGGETFTHMAIVISRLFSPTRFARGAECARQRMKAMIDRYFPRAHFFACVAFCPNPSPAGGSARACVWRMSKKVGEERYFISTFLDNFRFFSRSFVCGWPPCFFLCSHPSLAGRGRARQRISEGRRQTFFVFVCGLPVVFPPFVCGSECVRRRRKRRGGGTFYVL